MSADGRSEFNAKTMHTDMRMDEELVMLDKYGITPDELLFIKIALIGANESFGKDYARRYFSLSEEVRGSILGHLKSLQDKQVITKEYHVPTEGGMFNPKDVTFNKTFVKGFFKSSFEMGKELFDIYPLSTVVNGVEYKLRRVSKKFNSLEEAFFHYGKYINWSPEKHERVLALVEAGKRSGYQFSTLDSFIVDNDWLNLEALADKGQLTDNIRML